MRRRALMLGVASLAGVPLLVRAAQPTLGVTLPLTGVQREVARELELGYRMAAAEAGVGVVVMDDESIPDRVAANVKRLAADPAVTALSGIVGTPHAQAGLAAAKKGGLPVVGIRSGAGFLRKGDPSVFHLRASYEDELDKMVSYCVGAGIKQLAIIYSEDSFGTSSRDHLVSRLGSAGITLVSNLGVERNGSNIPDVVQKTAAVARSDGLTAIALLLIVKPMTAAATELRVKHAVMQPILAMSFTITQAVATTTDRALAGLGIVSAFPLPRAGVESIQQRYRAALAREGRTGTLTESVTAYEGFFYGTVASRAISAAAGNREAVGRVLRAGMSLGDLKVDFGSGMVGYHFLEFVHKSRDGLLRV